MRRNTRPPEGLEAERVQAHLPEPAALDAASSGAVAGYHCAGAISIVAIPTGEGPAPEEHGPRCGGAITLLGPWPLHDVQRVCIHPRLIRAREQRLPILIAALAYLFTSFNAWISPPGWRGSSASGSSG